MFMMIGMAIFAQKIPSVMKTEFSEIGLQEELLTLDGKNITIKEALNQYNGKIVVLDLWATWCKDCLIGMPKLKELQDKNPEVEFVYFSMDKTTEAWKNGIEKYEIKGNHYFIGNNWKNDFTSSIDLNWIPRYIILDQNGKIANYYAVNAEDPNVQATIDRLQKK